MSDATPQQRLSTLREAVFHLHKALIDSERTTYEKTFGRIASPNQFLQLLTSDPWFAWLQPLSQLIVAMDMALDASAKEPLTAASTDALMGQTRTLLTVSEAGEGFARNYFDALQRDPDVLFAHAKTVQLFHPPKSAA